ncbi:ADP-ribosylglycohydrolase family protein [Lentilactobacillus otakiensis]|uniref:ADP-ribosylglycohydrolase n=1 Tax=Lentilactobacillus otakiensis DSM 19908 = JCM 15040 TaxID=1423780 RepID=S4NER4_9LACO|nr:ADP-ribosylglycohydrolase family protein [Lentilactobacillus otakiensis]KRL08580.1 ADP-ribosylation Crystallin J1 [Lentilactobacillus otakiensis DSM 19908 = JCM 15040]MBZ3777637.1 ADP-ribosylglycohydrolase family protein [Lentilactobacillus otakiensis]MDV3518684.1 ADP-ribosylglycohydrolase family protein [Lentilactobacillus otakiensis]GAD17444.1 ADP-ribosylglycohydrolase [Lentilactobacillus otakiensis DSM 19908 = JCM 15040]
MYSTSYLLFQSLTAVALGDALGFPIQHDTRSNPFDEPVHEMVGHQTQEVPAGTWSDDTSLSIASLVSLTFGYNLHDLMTRYSQWYHFGDYTPFNYSYDIDETTKAALQRFDSGIEPKLCGGTMDSDNNNTALKRLMPLAFYLLTKNQHYVFNEATVKLIHDYTATTNRTPKTFIGSGILTNVIIRLIQNPNKYAMLRAVKEALDYYRSQDEYAAQVPFFEQLEEAHFLRQSSTKLRPSSDVIATLNAVFWCLMNSEQYNVAVSKAVNLGSDADTIGSITSMLASLLFAPVTFPESWLSKLQGRNQIKIAVSVALLSDNF